MFNFHAEYPSLPPILFPAISFSSPSRGLWHWHVSQCLLDHPALYWRPDRLGVASRLAPHIQHSHDCCRQRPGAWGGAPVDSCCPADIPTRAALDMWRLPAGGMPIRVFPEQQFFVGVADTPPHCSAAGCGASQQGLAIRQARGIQTGELPFPCGPLLRLTFVSFHVFAI